MPAPRPPAGAHECNRRGRACSSPQVPGASLRRSTPTRPNPSSGPTYLTFGQDSWLERMERRQDMMAFGVPRALSSFNDPYPLPSDLLAIVSRDGPEAATVLAQLWLSEGIPKAFLECPAVYDTVRQWLGNRLRVHPKQIGVVGSARLGRSLSPAKLDRPFQGGSDLDLFVVSRSVFDAVSGDFVRWRQDYIDGVVLPRSDVEKRYWSDNRDRCLRGIREGRFVDSNRIPNMERYPTAKSIAQTMFLLTRRLAGTPCSPTPKRATIRCYADWVSAIGRMRRNLESASRDRIATSKAR